MASAAPRRVLAALLLATALGLGAIYAIESFGRVPTYADTGVYIRLARLQAADPYRGVLYPRLLEQTDRLLPGRSILHRRAPGLSWIQALQTLVGFAALAAFVTTLSPPGSLVSGWSRRRRLLGSALLVALLWLDPLVSHFNLSIMTDSLALSASLVFCAAFGRALARRATPGAAAAMLASYLVLAAIRPEKNFVLLGTGLATIVGCLLWRRVRGPGSSPSPRRLIALGALVVVGFALAQATRSAPSKPNRRMPASEWILHHRIIYPHLTSVRDELPEDLERRFPPRVARRYDADPLGPRKVIARVARDAEDRARITRRLAAIVVREHWGTIALDVASDTVENLLATFSFYGRLGALAVADEETSAKLERLDGSGYTYAKLSEAAPALSRAYVAVSALLLLAGGVAGILELWARRGAASPPERRAARLAWLPTAAFCLTNALAFSLSANLVHIRYTLFAHVVIVAFVYSAPVTWALAPAAGMPRLSEAD